MFFLNLLEYIKCSYHVSCSPSKSSKNLVHKQLSTEVAKLLSTSPFSSTICGDPLVHCLIKTIHRFSPYLTYHNPPKQHNFPTEIKKNIHFCIEFALTFLFALPARDKGNENWGKMQPQFQ
uniref:HtrA protein n=1 Tax=Fopius arisanus TaxID=64838 RepID=A0A0C9QHM5_9HYME